MERVWLGLGLLGLPGQSDVQPSLGTSALGSENSSFSMASQRCVTHYVQTAEKIQRTPTKLCLVGVPWPYETVFVSLKTAGAPKENVRVLQNIRDLETKEYF